jgi:hypothetical protein
MRAMMALDAAGVPINQVLRDGKTRMEAIEAYEAEQRKLCEAQCGAERGTRGAGTLRELLAVLLC